MVRSTVKYFSHRNSNFYARSLDLVKAFNRIDQVALLERMLDYEFKSLLN